MSFVQLRRSASCVIPALLLLDSELPAQDYLNGDFERASGIGSLAPWGWRVSAPPRAPHSSVKRECGSGYEGSCALFFKESQGRVRRVLASTFCVSSQPMASPGTGLKPGSRYVAPTVGPPESCSRFDRSTPTTGSSKDAIILDGAPVAMPTMNAAPPTRTTPPSVASTVVGPTIVRRALFPQAAKAVIAFIRRMQTAGTLPPKHLARELSSGRARRSHAIVGCLAGTFGHMASA